MNSKHYTGQEGTIGALLENAIWDESVIGWEFKRLNGPQRHLIVYYAEQEAA